MRGKRFLPLPWRGLFCLLLFVSLCVLPANSGAAETGEFSGSWIATGTRELFRFGPQRNVYSFKLAGHVNLQTSIGKKKDYWSSCVGLADSVTGTIVRCVWRDLEDTEVYISLQSDQIQKDGLVTGTIVGGSKHLKDIQGEVSFKWSSVVFQQEGSIETVTGQALDLRGSYQLP